MSTKIKDFERTTSRYYITGSEWLYYKIYCGPKTGDKLLLDINSIAERLIEEKVITKWFFIRYGDPEFHIRVRFEYFDSEKIAVITKELHDMLQYYVDQDLVWKVMNDTYQPEIERYGLLSMHAAEDIFYYDSRMIVRLLDLLEGPEGERIRWLFSLRAMDEFISLFGLSSEEKLNLMRGLSMSFGEEHNKDESLAKQLSKIFRDNKKDIQDILDSSKDKESDWLPAIELIHDKSKNVSEAISFYKKLDKKKQLDFVIPNYIGSFLHMLNNRLFRSKNRLHELVVYDFLFRIYKSNLAREKYAKK
ncbi:MAG: thiopeptide-type bacteriocin biosynthesis protein [Hyphomicrobiales bacterium]